MLLLASTSSICQKRSRLTEAALSMLIVAPFLARRGFTKTMRPGTTMVTTVGSPASSSCSSFSALRLPRFASSRGVRRSPPVAISPRFCFVTPAASFTRPKLAQDVMAMPRARMPSPLGMALVSRFLKRYRLEGDARGTRSSPLTKDVTMSRPKRPPVVAEIAGGEPKVVARVGGGRRLPKRSRYSSRGRRSSRAVSLASSPRCDRGALRRARSKVSSTGSVAGTCRTMRSPSSAATSAATAPPAECPTQ
mmetsp:Transcript_42439/g.133050  ORF Transcript_42439/g.133050 Transcript_42439/m.133050 type:complete len:250 (+) Transcript_42439:2256-3005(+)